MAFRYIFMAILIALIFGFNSVVVKMGVKSVNPLMYAAWRYMLVWPLLLFVPRPKTSWKNIVLASSTVGGTVTLAAVILHLGVGAGLASVMMQTQVFFTAIFAIWLWKEWPTRYGWIGMTIAFTGVSCIALRMGEEVSILGIFLTLCAAICWAANNIVFRKVRESNIVHMMVWGSLVMPLPLMLLSAIFYGPLSVIENPLNFSSLTISSILFSGFVSGLGGSILSGILLKHNPVTVVAPFMLLVPVSSLIFAYCILEETLTLISTVGCILVLMGLAINQCGQREKGARGLVEVEAE
jgi:O-acetylserine/cysteine efflux transporter